MESKIIKELRADNANLLKQISLLMSQIQTLMSNQVAPTSSSTKNMSAQSSSLKDTRKTSDKGVSIDGKLDCCPESGFLIGAVSSDKPLSWIDKQNLKSSKSVLKNFAATTLSRRFGSRRFGSLAPLTHHASPAVAVKSIFLFSIFVIQTFPGTGEKLVVVSYPPAEYLPFLLCLPEFVL